MRSLASTSKTGFRSAVSSVAHGAFCSNPPLEGSRASCEARCPRGGVVLCVFASHSTPIALCIRNRPCPSRGGSWTTVCLCSQVTRQFPPASRFGSGLSLDHRPSRIRGRRECRAFSHTRSLVRKIRKHTSLSHHRFAVHAGIPCTMVLRFISRSPRRPGSLTPSLAADAANLTPASGRQDDATSSYAAQRFVRRITRLTPSASHRIPRPTSVTIAIRPSSWSARRAKV